ncbi:hypothetical protein ACH5RR_035353 [Cinchona calisaya]|uniref:F-box domain-containing protein n=1 Tax=Cinchona calisaya TaxID=153742 RepID=A0ABD2YDM2_9GENT
MDDPVIEYLPEELILEIVSRLPLKYAVQCKCLNKNMNKFISDPNFAIHHTLRNHGTTLLHCASFRAQLFGKISLDPPHTVNYLGLGKGIKESVVSPILISPSTGRIVIQFLDTNFYCVFNPITGAYRRIPPSPFSIAKPLAIGLVDEASSPSFKLVAVFDVLDFQQRSRGKQIFKFEIFESENNSWRGLNCLKRITCDSSKFAWASDAVYLQGRLHWLRQSGDVLAFDVNNECGHLIRKPQDIIYNSLDDRSNFDVRESYYHQRQGTWFGVDTWFGIAQGSLTLAIAFREKIIIYVLEVVDGENGYWSWWRSKNEFGNHISLRDRNRNGRPVFYNGKTLIFLSGDRNLDIYEYHIKDNIWNKIGKLACWSDCIRSFHHFIPTLANIPNSKHLGQKPEPSLGDILPRLCNLRSLLLQ